MQSASIMTHRASGGRGGGGAPPNKTRGGGAPPEPLQLGRYPTPVQRIDALCTPECALWVKRDDMTNDEYGGNKVRKLEHVLAEVKAEGASRIITIGAAGSHHVLATTYFGTRVGLSIEAALVPQLRTEHVAEVLRAALACGVRALPVRSWALVPFRVGTRVVAGSRFVPPGGSNTTGCMGYVNAAAELAAQVRQGAMPEPDVCVVPLGSGGTAAGLAVGFAAQRLKTKVVGVCVSGPACLVRAATQYLVRRCARRAGVREGLVGRLTLDWRFLGAGYGIPTAQGAEATVEAQEKAGLVLDPTYTSKAFANALWQVRARRAHCVLYWHTLSSAPMWPLLRNAGPEATLDPALRSLLALTP